MNESERLAELAQPLRSARAGYWPQSVAPAPVGGAFGTLELVGTIRELDTIFEEAHQLEPSRRFVANRVHSGPGLLTGKID